MKGIYLLLGSNLGDRPALLKEAARLIEIEIGNVVSASSVYTTKAWGIEEQPDFLNQVVEIESSLSPQVMLKKINHIEKSLGRVRYVKWDSRVIDIDILYYGDRILDSDGLVIPHVENEHRNFVLVPICEIAPEFPHPVLLRTQRELLENCTDTLEVRICNQ